MPLLKGFMNAIAPQIENTEEALQEGLESITFAKKSRRDPDSPQPHQISRVQTQTEQTHRVNTPPPPIPDRNQARPGYTLRIRQIQREHHRGHEHQNPEYPVPQHQPEPQKRPRSLTKAELSKYLRETRPGFRREKAPRGHPQPKPTTSTMAGTKPQRITSHQVFLKGQVKNQQDATDAWARRTGKPTPPYQFEDFIGKGAYGRVFKA